MKAKTQAIQKTLLSVQNRRLMLNKNMISQYLSKEQSFQSIISHQMLKEELCIPAINCMSKLDNEHSVATIASEIDPKTANSATNTIDEALSFSAFSPCQKLNDNYTAPEGPYYPLVGLKKCNFAFYGILEKATQTETLINEEERTQSDRSPLNLIKKSKIKNGE